MITWLSLKGAMVSKAILAAALASGTFSFLAVDWLTGNAPMAILLSAISAPAAAYFASRPKVIAAQAAREVGQRTLTQGEMGALFERAASLHAEEVNMLRTELRRRERMEALVRISKHNAIAALTDAWVWIDNARELCSGKMNLPEYAKVNVASIYKEEDRELLLMATGKHPNDDK